MSVLKITRENFRREVLESEKPVLLDFWASWCGPCKMVSPIIDQVAEEKKGMIKVGKINIDEEEELAAQFRIMSIPTLVVMKDGKIVESTAGVKPKNAILSLLSE